MTLPNEEVMDLLRDQFIVGARNIERDGHVGLSHGYRPDQCAVGTTNGAGGRNVQLVVLGCDETVLHVLPGFWHAQDLVQELRLALEVHRLHQDDRSLDEKKKMFATLHRSFLNRHGQAMQPRSEWQGFDQSTELMRAQGEPRDTVVVDAAGKATIKPLVQVVHERMQTRPFLKLAAFGMETYVDYGQAFYDNNRGFDRGKDFPRAEQANAKRVREQQKEAAEQETLKKKLEKAARSRQAAKSAAAG
ncbi:MAG: hypothetical protein JNK15_21365 [Planctomycetes bacterium]|nr:hypothetical protein [Planctomycetota bacterium]